MLSDNYHQIGMTWLGQAAVGAGPQDPRKPGLATHPHCNPNRSICMGPGLPAAGPSRPPSRAPRRPPNGRRLVDGALQAVDWGQPGMLRLPPFRPIAGRTSCPAVVTPPSRFALEDPTPASQSPSPRPGRLLHPDLRTLLGHRGPSRPVRPRVDPRVRSLLAALPGVLRPAMRRRGCHACHTRAAGYRPPLLRPRTLADQAHLLECGHRGAVHDLRRTCPGNTGGAWRLA